jgi:hypothetical protein
MFGRGGGSSRQRAQRRSILLACGLPACGRGLCALVLLTLAAGCQKKPQPDPVPAAPSAIPAPKAKLPPPRPEPTLTRISMLSGTEKRGFLTEMASKFQRENPQYELLLDFAGSVEIANRLLEGRGNPLIISPADSSIITMMAQAWRSQNGSLPPLFDQTGEAAPRSLFKSPLVLVAWPAQAAALEKAGGGRVTWQAVRKSASVAKLGQADPAQSNSGLLALLSMALENQGGKRPLTTRDLQNRGLESFIRDVEKKVAKFEISTGVLADQVARQGPAGYDAAVLYESAAITTIDKSQRRWGELKVLYLTPSLWGDHPVALVRTGNMSPSELKGALAWLALLRSRPGQERALAHGFRPADPEISLQTPDSKNPFHRLAGSGVSVATPPLAPAPPPALIRDLLALWKRLGLH